MGRYLGGSLKRVGFQSSFIVIAQLSNLWIRRRLITKEYAQKIFLLDLSNPFFIAFHTGIIRGIFQTTKMQKWMMLGFNSEGPIGFTRVTLILPLYNIFRNPFIVDPYVIKAMCRLGTCLSVQSRQFIDQSVGSRWPRTEYVHWTYI